MERILPVLVVASVLILGFIIRLHSLTKIKKRLEYTCEYRADFIKLMDTLYQSNELDQTLYFKLTKEVGKMQRELGHDGIGLVKDPLRGFSAKNYPLLINFLPEFQRILNESRNSIMWERFVNSANDCDNMFVRHEGNLEELLELYRKRLFNPFSCFAEGIRQVTSFPVTLLQWLGLISENCAHNVRNSIFAKLFNNIVVLLGVISAIITIALGWDEFLSLIHTVFAR